MPPVSDRTRVISPETIANALARGPQPAATPEPEPPRSTRAARWLLYLTFGLAAGVLLVALGFYFGR